MASLLLSDTWPISDYTKWNHAKTLQWISHLNTTFSQQYHNEFVIAKVNGNDFQLLSDTDYLEAVFSMNQQHAASFSLIIISRMNNYIQNKNHPSIQQLVQSQTEEQKQPIFPIQKSLQNNGPILDTQNLQKQEYPFLNGEDIPKQAPPLQTRNSFGMKSVSPILPSSPPLQSMSPKLQPISMPIIQQQSNDNQYSNSYHNGYGSMLNINKPHDIGDFPDGPELPKSKSMAIDMNVNNDNNNDNNNDMDSDDEMYNPNVSVITPDTPTPQNICNDIVRKFSTYDTPRSDHGAINDAESDDDEIYKKYETKGGGIAVEQSETELSSQIDIGAVLSDIDEKQQQQHQRNSLVEVHKHNHGVAQLLIKSDDNDFKQLDIQLNECKKIWNKQRALDANIEFVYHHNQNGHHNNNNKAHLITLRCMRKLEQLLVIIGGQEAVTLFFNINREISQTALQSILISAHTNNIGNNENYKLFSKLKNTPNVSKRETHNTDYSMMISIDFDIGYAVIIQNEHNYKQILMAELSIILEINESFIQIISSGQGNGSWWHLNVKVEMWSFLYSLKGIKGNINGRKRNILNYQFKNSDHIDVNKKNKWYLCKIKAITDEAKYLETKGKNIRIGYIGKYVERNGQIIKEMGKPFKLKNTEWIWSIADKQRIRVQELNVTESMSNQFLKIAFRG